MYVSIDYNFFIKFKIFLKKKLTAWEKEENNEQDEENSDEDDEDEQKSLVSAPNHRFNDIWVCIFSKLLNITINIIDNRMKKQVLMRILSRNANYRVNIVCGKRMLTIKL